MDGSMSSLEKHMKSGRSCKNGLGQEASCSCTACGAKRFSRGRFFRNTLIAVTNDGQSCGRQAPLRPRAGPSEVQT